MSPATSPYASALANIDLRLPPELWLRIFKLMIASPLRVTPLLQAILVCQRWKDMATPVLFEDITLQTRTQTRLLSRVLIESDRERGQAHVGRWIHSLSLLKGACSDEAQVVLLYAPNLHCLITDFETPLSYLVSLHRGTTSGLSRLHMHITRGNEDAFDFIRRFEYLEELAVSFSGTPVFDRKSQPLSLARLSHLQWTWKGPLNVEDMALLVECRFPQLRNITIYMPRLSTNLNGQLLAFLQAHPGETLTLDLPRSTIAALALRVKVSFHHLILPNAVPPPGFFAPLEGFWAGSHDPPYILRTLCVTTSLPGSDLFSFLTPATAIFTSRVSWPSLNLCVHLSNSRFTWACGRTSDDHALFVGKLLAHAIELGPDVRILDDNGNDFRCV